MQNSISYFILFLLIISSGETFAQVSYSARYENISGEGRIIKVYVKSTTTYASPSNQTATGQVTFKVPTGMIPNIVSKYTDVNVNNLITLYDNGIWEPNARVNNPSSQPGYDFISFGLTSLGTTAIEYLADQEVPLFSFEFTGPCNGELELIDNANDAFVNNGVSSPENAISVLGAGGSAFSGLYSINMNPCEEGKEIAYYKINFECDAPEDDTYVYNDSANNDIDDDGIPNANDPDPLDSDKQLVQFRPSETSYGTLAFEDLWPYNGDYDFNDFIIEVKETVVTNTENDIYQVVYDLKIVAMGGKYNNDFAIALPDPNNAITFSVYSDKNIQSAVDHDGELAIVKINGPKALLTSDVTTLINALPESTHLDPIELQIIAEMDGAYQYPSGYNPKFFIERDGGNGIEIHLPGVEPTGKIISSIFGTGNDNSIDGTYYTNTNNLPWALYIPISWEYPTEGVDLLEAYFRFDEYVQQDPSLNWYLNTASYRNVEKVYKPE
ncbi:MAG: LruC domain-containing protein [Saprospiraceae bacterium]